LNSVATNGTPSVGTVSKPSNTTGTSPISRAAGRSPSNAVPFVQSFGKDEQTLAAIGAVERVVAGAGTIDLLVANLSIVAPGTRCAG
jgi:hypothetical protein